jgi:hypothetical protein
MELPENMKLELPYDSAIPLLGMYLKESKCAYHRNSCMSRFIVALFKTVNYENSLGTNQWMDLLRGIFLSHKEEQKLWTTIIILLYIKMVESIPPILL